jgi:hypothetical protein
MVVLISINLRKSKRDERPVPGGNGALAQLVFRTG